MTDAEGQLRAELADDGLHPNDEGYKVMGSLARTAIGAALQSRGKKKRKKRLGAVLTGTAGRGSARRFVVISTGPNASDRGVRGHERHVARSGDTARKSACATSGTFDIEEIPGLFSESPFRAGCSY